MSQLRPHLDKSEKTLLIPQPLQNTFVAPPPVIGQHQESNRLHDSALNRLQYRHDIHKNIQEQNVQINQQNSLTLKFELTVRQNNIVQYPFPLDPPNITAQFLPPPFITTEIIYKYDRFTKKTIGYIAFYNPYSGLSYTQDCKDIHISTPIFSHFFRTKSKSLYSHRTSGFIGNTPRL